MKLQTVFEAGIRTLYYSCTAFIGHQLVAVECAEYTFMTEKEINIRQYREPWESFAITSATEAREVP